MPNKEDDLYLVIGTEDGYFDKTLTTSFNEKELFNTLRKISYESNLIPDELKVRPDFFRKLEEYSFYYDTEYLEHAKKYPLPTYCNVKVIIDKELDKPFKFMKGGKEV